jgi:hypothetical protein
MSNSPKSVPATPVPSVVPRQLSIVFDSIRLRGMSASERTKTIVCLANLLMRAAGVAMGERDDDER